jgi:hypothetical protein
MLKLQNRKQNHEFGNETEKSRHSLKFKRDGRGKTFTYMRYLHSTQLQENNIMVTDTGRVPQRSAVMFFLYFCEKIVYYFY